LEAQQLSHPRQPGKRGENCPEVLSQLLRDGYAISDVGHYDKDSDYVVFLLTRGR
jgi:hypothetical protein